MTVQPHDANLVGCDCCAGCQRAARPRHLRISTMSASTPSAAEADTAREDEAPEIEALFLIRFDKKVG